MCLPFNRLLVTVCALSLFAGKPTVSFAQTVGESTTSFAPTPSREVIAEGSAAVGTGGLVAARKVAMANALRAAVEQTAGVYVTANALVRNYQLIRDDVMTHAEGFAKLEALLQETDSKKDVHVTVRVQVSLRPLTQALKALNLTRAWRVHIQSRSEGFLTANADVTAAIGLEKALLDAGMTVVATDIDADIIVQMNAHYFDDRTTVVHDGVVKATRGETVDADIRVINNQTGDVIALLTGSYTQGATFGDFRPLARGLVADMGPRLTDALLILPEHSSQIVQLQVDGLGSLPRAVRFENDLAALPEILSVTRRRYENGSGFWELQVFDGDQNDTANDLEVNARLKAYHLTVLSDILGKISAAANTKPDAPSVPRLVRKASP